MRAARSEGETMTNTTALCDFCGGELHPGTTRLELWLGEELIVITDVPGDVCDQCGEAYLSAETSEQLDRLVEERESRAPEKYLRVPQYSAENAKAGP